MNEEDEINIFKQVFNTYGPLLSIKKDVKLINFFRSEPDKDIRQRTVIDNFPNWASETVRKHLRKLVKLGVLEESKKFRGTYRFPPRGRRKYFSDMDALVEVLVGYELYSMAKLSWGKKIKNDDYIERY